MTLTPGGRLGPFEITSAIGAGGMGEVFRARDTKLNRDVAIKVLPPAFADDPERLARFTREAQTLASLNHPNIATIYGIEEIAGSESGSGSASRALVMELVEGEDLSTHIARGPMPITDVLPIARQIAEALEAAHERGIVHRDLKPANIKVRADGTVKVLDFGLAKAMDQGGTSSSSPNVSHSPTVTHQGTSAGMIIGTAAYMSPEQAKGKSVDKRADIWAFGVVLYEMLSGKRAFKGDDVSETLASVLKDALPLDTLPADTPPRLKRLIARCLERDLKTRLRDIGEARVKITRIEAGTPDSEAMVPETATGPAVPASHRVLRILAPAFVGAALVGIVVGLTGWGRDRARAPPVQRLTIETSTLPGRIAISRDGARVLIQSGGTLEVRSLSEFESTPVKGLDIRGLRGAVFSPDGLSIAFSVLRTLKRIPVSGGVVSDIAELPDSPDGCNWSGEYLYCGLGARGVVRVMAGGGPVEQVITLSPGEHAANPFLLEGSDVLLFAMAPGTMRPDWRLARIVAQSLSSGRREVVVEAGADPRHFPTGHIAYAVEGVWFAAAFDPATLRITGSPVPMISGVLRGAPGGQLAPGVRVDVSDMGTLIYLAGPASLSNSTQIVFADRTGRERTLKLKPAEYEAPRVSPDGRQLALGTDGQAQAAVWIYDLSEDHAIRRLTFSGRSRLPVWSPDGKRVAYQSDQKGDPAIFVQDADGAGEVEQITTASGGATHIPESWSRDGRYLSYSVVTPTGVELWLRSMADGTVARFGDLRSNAPLNSVLSPDGKWLAYTLRGEGAARVFVQPVPPTGARYQITEDNDASHHPFWSPDGKELFHFAIGGGTLVSSSITVRGGVTSGQPVRIPGRHFSLTTVTGPLAYDMTPDGREFVFNRRPSDAPAAEGAALERPSIRVVLNWFEELKAKVKAP